MATPFVTMLASPAVELRKMNAEEIVAVCFISSQPMKSNIGLKIIPPLKYTQASFYAAKLAGMNYICSHYK